MLHKIGVKIFVMGRDGAKGRRVTHDISAADPDCPAIDVIEIDHQSLQTVRDGAAEFLKRSAGKLIVLTANAGVVAPPESKT